jgi:hypothetical protein
LQTCNLFHGTRKFFRCESCRSEKPFKDRICCARCRVTYYCSKDCQQKHQKEHGKKCEEPNEFPVQNRNVAEKMAQLIPRFQPRETQAIFDWLDDGSRVLVFQYHGDEKSAQDDNAIFNAMNISVKTIIDKKKEVKSIVIARLIARKTAAENGYLPESQKENNPMTFVSIGWINKQGLMYNMPFNLH